MNTQSKIPTPVSIDKEVLEIENEKLKRLLHDLTPGGSEFYNDPEYCAKWIRDSRTENHYALSGIIKEQKRQLEELYKVLTALQNVCGIIPREVFTETGQRDFQAILDASATALQNSKL